MNIQTNQVAKDESTALANGTAVVFPKGQRESESPIFVRNELFIAAPAARVFAALIRPIMWPTFYANAKNIEVEGGPELALGTLFHWTTFGVRVHTTIVELVPSRRLAWSGRALGSTAYHGWVIEPRDGGCMVVAEETQQGFVPWACRSLLVPGMLKWHQRWLEGLAKVAAEPEERA